MIFMPSSFLFVIGLGSTIWICFRVFSVHLNIVNKCYSDTYVEFYY